MVPYDDQQVADFCTDCDAAFVKAGQVWNARAGVWPARMQFDAVSIGYPAARAKQLTALYIALGLTPPFPQAPPRDQVCGIKITFQGLTVNTQQFGSVNWFETFLQCCQPNDRQAVYDAKHAAHDTHAIVEFLPGGPVYDESPFQQFVSPDYEAIPQAFLALIEEIILAGFIPLVVYNGDNADNPSDGYPNAARQAPILSALLASSGYGDLNRYVLYGRLWDGVFYGSSPANIAAFGQLFRSLLPNGYLAIEHNVGHIPSGGGEGDWNPGGAMSDYDVVLSEFNNGLPRTNDQNPDTNPGSSIWMIVDRLVRPWNRPPDMPTGPQWDPSPPFYFASGSARGPYFYCAFEFDEYRWVRGQVSAAEVASERAYLQAMGCTFTG